MARIRRAAEGVAQSKGEEAMARSRELEAVLDGLMDMKKEWEQWQT